MKNKYILGLIAALILIQFIRIDKSEPEHDMRQDYLVLENPDKDVALLLKVACYDCHSYKTKYPWYSNIAPVSWWLKRHINGGRAHLNYSVWGSYDENKKAELKKETAKIIEKKWMPIGSYKLMHKEARLTDEERTRLVEHFSH